MAQRRPFSGSASPVPATNSFGASSSPAGGVSMPVQRGNVDTPSHGNTNPNPGPTGAMRALAAHQLSHAKGAGPKIQQVHPAVPSLPHADSVGHPMGPQRRPFGG